MSTIDFILYVLAAICFGAAALGVQARVNLTALGLFFWVVTFVLAGVPK